MGSQHSSQFQFQFQLLMAGCVANISSCYLHLLSACTCFENCLLSSFAHLTVESITVFALCAHLDTAVNLAKGVTEREILKLLFTLLGIGVYQE